MMNTQKVLALLITSLTILSIVSFTGVGEETRLDRGIRIEIEDEKLREEVFVNITEEFKINIIGFFELDGDRINVEDSDEWTLEVESSAEATIEPEEQTSNETSEFIFDVTIHEEGKTDLEFTAYCTKDNVTRYSERRFEVRAVEAEVLSVDVTNPTSYELEEIKLNLYINGEFKNSKTIQDVEPEETRTVQFNWSRRDLEPGEHELEIKADYGLTSEKVILSHSFHIEGDGNTALYGGIIVISIAAGLLLFFFFRQKRKRRRRPW